VRGVTPETCTLSWGERVGGGGRGGRERIWKSPWVLSWPVG